MRRTAVLVGMILAVAVSTQAQAQTVLVYDHDSHRHAAQTACTGLGLACTVADSATFVGLLTGQSWDLVVMDMPGAEPLGDWQTPLGAYIAGGGRAIQTGWLRGDFTTLALTYQVTLGAQHDAITLYQWNGSPLFTTPNGLPSPLNVVADLWNSNGFYLTSAGGTGDGAGFTASPTAGQAGIVIGNGGRTFFNGFLFDDYAGADANGDGKDDCVALVQNEMLSALAAGVTLVPTLGSVGIAAMPLLFAALGTLLLSRRSAGI